MNEVVGKWFILEYVRSYISGRFSLEILCALGLPLAKFSSMVYIDQEVARFPFMAGIF